MVKIESTIRHETENLNGRTCHGSKENLAVEWRGPVLPATFLSFIDGCEAVRAGAKNPPDPAVAR